jgi:hypothetical protein
MRIEMSSEAVSKRLKIVNELRRICLSLANSSEGKRIQKTYSANKQVQRTAKAVGRRVARYPVDPAV